MSETKLVVVLGMHRSGTSVITSLVESCGISTGDNLQGAGPDNPKGYWEDEFIVNTNNKLLRSLGFEWHSLSWLDAAALRKSPFNDELMQTSTAYLADLLRRFPKLVVKDPRMAITLPFWLEVFAALKVSPQFVITKRHPSAIGRSLVTRDYFDQEYAAQLIYLYWASIVHHLPIDAPRIKVDYEQVSKDEAGQRQRLFEFLGMSAPNQPSSSLFDPTLERSGNDQSEVGFVWQQVFFAEFPDVSVPVDKILALKGYFTALSRAYLPNHLQKVTINEIFAVADNLKNQKIVLYGASHIAALVSGVLNEQITLAVDHSATQEEPLQRYGLTFLPLEALADSDHDCVLVAVTGRQSAIAKSLSALTTQPLYFLEDWLFKG
jgi:hypothetical protein